MADVADAFRSHVPLIAELAVASISGDVGQSARQVEALRDICACFEQLPKVNNHYLLHLAAAFLHHICICTLVTLTAACPTEMYGGNTEPYKEVAM